MQFPVINSTNALETLSERQHSTQMPQHKLKRQNQTATHKQIQKRLPFTISRQSIANERHPTRNEDSMLIDEMSGLIAIFDGVGGSAAAEIASQTAARATLEGWRQVRNERPQHQRKRKTHTLLDVCGKRDLCAILEKLMLNSHDQVRTDGAQRAGTDDLATTVALATFCRRPEEKNYTMVYGHVGDSRIYLLRGKEPLQRLTSDDGLLTRLVENQILNDFHAQRIDQATSADELSDIEYSYFRMRGGITQALGASVTPVVHTNQITICPGDRILFCTDGIHDNLTDSEIEDILRNTVRIASAHVLVEHARQRSREDRNQTIRPKPDDMSAIVMTCRF